MSLTRDNTTSIHSDNVEDIGEINNTLMVEASVTKQNEQFKDDHVYPLNDVKDVFQGKRL